MSKITNLHSNENFLPARYGLKRCYQLTIKLAMVQLLRIQDAHSIIVGRVNSVPTMQVVTEIPINTYSSVKVVYGIH